MLGLAAGQALPAGELMREVKQAIGCYPLHAAPIEKLRAAGPAGLDELFALRDSLQAQLAKEANEHLAADLRHRLRDLDAIIDQVGKQRYCSRSRLYWYTDFDKAVDAARSSGKPILSLRMLGNLDEDFSCANSRFFRTTLYANDEISKTLRENFVLHWKSVRPVPKVTIDFGDGRKLERTITGNSAHYILTPDGDVVDCLPGLYGPQAFLTKLGEGLEMAKSVSGLGATERREALVAWHNAQFSKLSAEFGREVAALDDARSQLANVPPAAGGVPRADAAAAIARPKMRMEARLIAGALPTLPEPGQLEDEAVWQAIAARHAGEAKLDPASRDLIRSENPLAAVAGRLAITKRIVEDPLLKLVASLESSIALDTVKNEYRFHRQIHGWLNNLHYQPGIDELNERVYAELFLTPSSDPWLGLAAPDVYTALPNSGVVREERR
jgi:hypothetical protein